MQKESKGYDGRNILLPKRSSLCWCCLAMFVRIFVRVILLLNVEKHISGNPIRHNSCLIVGCGSCCSRFVSSCQAEMIIQIIE